MADDEVEETEETPEDEEEEASAEDEETTEASTEEADEEETEDEEVEDEEVEDEETEESSEEEDTEEGEAADEESDEGNEEDAEAEAEAEEDEDIEEVETSMEEGDSEEEEDTQTKPIVKSDGEYYGTGRRKEAVARVWIEAGSGEITVNDQDVDQYFQNRKKWTMAVRAPLETVDFEGEIDIWATAEGGGLTGQADAVKLGVARALCEMDENARSWLRSDGHLTRDDREVERKKINQPGARAKQQVSKR